MNKFYVNDKNDNVLTQTVVNVIRNAKQYIKTGNFLFQDNDFVKEVEAALARGVAVFIISNLKGEEQKPTSGKKREVKVDTHISNLERLKVGGAHCRFLDSLHAKFIVADGNEGILMSANYSPNSMQGNIETGVSLEQDEIEDLEYTFDVLFMNADIQEFGRVEKKRQVIRSYSPVSPDSFSTESLPSNIRLTVAPPGNNKRSRYANNLKDCHVTTIYRSILEIIRNATEYIYIVTWHFNSLDALPEFTEAIKNAIHDGVKVFIYSNDEQENRSVEESRNAIQTLIGMGCVSKGDAINHSKCVITESEGIIFTANIDGKSGLTTGFEVGCVLDGQALDDYRQYVKSLFE